MDYGGWTTFVEAFTIVEQYDCALNQHDAINLIYLLVDSSISVKDPAATTRLAEAEVDKTLYCWFCGQLSHANKDRPWK